MNNILSLVATHNNYKSWEELVAKTTKKKTKFSIPNYLHYNNSTETYSCILNAIKEAGLKLIPNKTEDGLLISK